MKGLIAAVGAFDIAVIVIIGVAVAAVIGGIIYKKVTGKGSGCCDCSSCSGCSACSHCKPDEKTDNK